VREGGLDDLSAFAAAIAGLVGPFADPSSFP
jgi:hypothetical protein